jgi:hypothetical protein
VILFRLREELAKCQKKQLFIWNKLGRQTIVPPAPLHYRATNGSKSDVSNDCLILYLGIYFPMI